MTYNFCVSDFEGPLDLLLHLVKESKVDIYEINIRTIIDQYLDFIHSLEEKNIDIASEYLVMASELIHLKSKLLINRQDEETSSEDEFSITSEEDLRNKLLEYEKYKQITKSFQDLEEKRAEVYTKLPESLKEFIDTSTLQKGEFDIEDLFNAYQLFIDRQKLAKPLNTKITKKELSIDDKIKDIKFDGEACAISTSATSIMIKLLIGKPVDVVKEIALNYDNMINEKEYNREILGEALCYEDIYKQQNRKTCATLSWKGLAKALDEYQTKK